jgi:D-lyxose ketol-isomerase
MPTVRSANPVAARPTQPLVLRARDRSSAIGRYQELYARAYPGAGTMPANVVEIATFGLSETIEDFQRVGLGLWTIDISYGGHYTGKVLMNLPGQILPQHRHNTTYIGYKGFFDGLVQLGKVEHLVGKINDFKGIYEYNPDGTVKMCAKGPKLRFDAEIFDIVQPASFLWELNPEIITENNITVLPGKIETFRPVFGHGILFCNRDEVDVLHPKQAEAFWRVPQMMRRIVAQAQERTKIITGDTLFLTGGVIVRLHRNANHAFVAGKDGAVYEEYSAESMDCGDRFVDPAIFR